MIDSFEGLTPGALWEDLKTGVKYLRAWKRIALVTDIRWTARMAALFGWITPGDVKVFPPAE